MTTQTELAFRPLSMEHPAAVVRGRAARTQAWVRCADLLRRAGLRPTRQRMALGAILFAQGKRHITADTLYEEAAAARIHVSLATIYNTLNQFTEAGLLRQIGVDSSKSFFDTNLTDHHHFYVEGEDVLLDIPLTEASLGELPEPPEGYVIERIDVVVRLRRTSR